MKTTHSLPSFWLNCRRATPGLLLMCLLSVLCHGASAAPVITTVVQTGGDTGGQGGGTADAAQWTGNTFSGTTIGTYSVPLFDVLAKSFTDRVHAWTNASGTVLIPPYLLGQPYIMSRNDNRDNNGLLLTITVSQDVLVYLLVDNRCGDGANGNAPHNPTNVTLWPGPMSWVGTDGFRAVTTSRNRTANATLPDEVGIDEAADGTINNWFSVYSNSYPAGTFVLRQQNAGAYNMYGVVVVGVGPPAAPMGLTAVSSDSQVSLKWNGVSGSSLYYIKRSATSGSGYNTVGTTSATNFTDTGLVNGLDYFYVVSGTNALGEGMNSGEAVGHPNVPVTGITATGGTGQVQVAWNLMPNATAYTVKRGASAAGPFSPVASGIVGTSYLDTTVVNGTTYYYIVIAQLVGGDDSGVPPAVAGTTAPTAPSGLAASLLAATVIKLTWAESDPAISQFRIEDSADGISFTPFGTVPGGARSYAATGLSPSSTHYFRVIAENSGGPSSPSNISAPVTAPSWGLNVNFANPTFATNFPGYINDYGSNYQLHANGYSYGWDMDNVQYSRERNSVNSPPDKRYDTFNHMQKTPAPFGRVWEIEITNGFYQVRVVAGDPDNNDTVFQHDIEGVLTTAIWAEATNRFCDYTYTCAVGDGRLSISNGPYAWNNKISFVDIYAATATPPVIGTQPASQSVQVNHPLTLSVGLASGSTPVTYQWSFNGVDIPGANQATYSEVPTSAGSQGDYAVKVSNFAGTNTSMTATVTVTTDTTQPTVVSISSADGITIDVCFSEAVDFDTASDEFNYMINGEFPSSAVLLADRHTVRLIPSMPIGEYYAVLVENVLDLNSNPNATVTVNSRTMGLTGVDVGAAPPTPGGQLSCDGNRLTIWGAGTNLAGAADQFHLVHCAVQGDFDVRVRVNEIMAPTGLARLLLMTRENTSAGSRFLSLSLNPPQPGRNYGEPIARLTANGNTSSWGTNFWGSGGPLVPLDPVAGYWLRLRRAGNAFSAYHGANGVTWTLAATTTQTWPLSMLVGVGIESADSSNVATGIVSNLEIIWPGAQPVLINPMFSGGSFTASFQTLNGYAYQILYKDSVTDLNWTLLTTVTGNGNTVPFTDPGPIPPGNHRIYRARYR